MPVLTTCALCGQGRGRPILCHGCAAAARKDLARIPAIHDLLAERLAAHSRGGPRISGTPSVGIELNERVAAVRNDLRRSLQAWATLVVEERDVTPPPDRLRDIAAFLLRHHDWLVTQPYADEYADEMRDRYRKAHGLADAIRPRQYGGPCLDLDDQAQPCPGVVLVDPDTRRARCTHCGTASDADTHWARVFAAVDDDWLVTATEAAHVLQLRDGIDLDPRRVRVWAHRGRIAAHGRRDAQPLYRLGDMLDILAATDVDTPKQPIASGA